jgi:hypothetical protein
MAPRTGCTAVGAVLTESFGAEWIPSAPIEEENGKFVVRMKHATLSELLAHGVLDPEELPSLLTFTTVRNPFDSLVTLYTKQRSDYAEADPAGVNKLRGYAHAMRMAAELDFPDWIRWYVRPKSRKARVRSWIPGLHPRGHLYRSFIEGASVIMRFEELQADFDRVLGRLGLPATPIPELNVSKSRSRDYREYYDRTSRRLVEKRFAPDLERFGYEF